MTLDEAKQFYQVIKDLKKRYGISYSDYHEEECDGEIRFVNIVLKLKIERKKRVDMGKRFDTECIKRDKGSKW